MDPLHTLTLGDVLREHARSRPQTLAAVDGDTRLPYAGLDARVNRLAAAFAAEGVNAGERVLWLGQNSFRLLEGLLAAAKLGALFCPANWRQRPEELAFVVDDLDPRVVIWQEEEVGDASRAARARVGGRARWVQHDGDDGYEDWVAGQPAVDPDRPVDPASPLLVIYTAAFEGKPNGAMLSHTACISQGLVYGHYTGTTADDVYLNSGPLFHLGTLMHTFATFVAGGTNVFVRRVDAELLCRVIAEERCTGAFLVGPTVEQVLDARAAGGHDLSSLRSAPGRPAWDAVTSPDTSAWACRPGGYGQTEVMGMITYSCLGLDATGTHGRSSPLARVAVFDEDDRELPPGEVGELVVRGPTVMSGYWNRPEENARRQRGGWHHTRDLGRREADGSITFIGPEDAHDQVGGGEHLPRRGRALRRDPPGGRRVRGDRRPRRHVGAEREGRRRAARMGRRSAPTSSSSTAGPRWPRTRSHGRWSSSTRSPAPGSSSTTTRSTPASAVGTTRAGGRAARERAVPHGSFRRRLRVVVSEPGLVEGGLEDDFHYFQVALRHDGERVESMEARSLRWPWSTCPGAAEPLRALAGMPLSPRLPRRRGLGRPADELHPHVRPRRPRRRARCAGGPPGTTRQYDLEIPAGAQLGGRHTVRLWRDGVERLAWVLDGRACVDPPPYSETRWRGGFLRWADEHLPVDEAEAAIVLRRGCDIGMGRGMDLDAVPCAVDIVDVQGAVCHTMQPGTVELSRRNRGTIRDFDTDPDRLLAEGP